MVAQSALDRLLDEMARGMVAPERYSTKSAYGRVEQLVRTTALAVIAVIAGVLLGGRSGSGGTRAR